MRGGEENLKENMTGGQVFKVFRKRTRHDRTTFKAFSERERDRIGRERFKILGKGTRQDRK